MASVLQVATIKDQGGNNNAIEIANSSANVTINNLAAGTIGSGVNLPAGTVVQVAQGFFNDDGNKSLSTSNTVVDSNWNASLTPRKTGNRIIIRVEMCFGLDSSHGIGINVKRTGPSTVDIIKGTGSSDEAYGTGGTHQAVNWFYRVNNSHSANINILFATTYDVAQDTTTAHVYYPLMIANGNQTVKLNRRWSDSLWKGSSSITVMEIAS